MAAPVKISGGKIVFQKSHFNHPTTQHEKCITDHWFNAAVNVTIPNSTSLPVHNLDDELKHIVGSERYSTVSELPITTLIREEFIEGFMKRGKVYMLSRLMNIDSDDCVCLLPTGHLILNLTKDTYETLGLEGKPSRFNHKKVRKFVVTIDLVAPCFKEGRKGYERIKDRLEIWDKTFDCFVQWKPDDENICPSSLPAFLHRFSDLPSSPEKRAHRHAHSRYPDSRVPVIAGHDQDGEEDENVDWEEFYDWLGCRACGVGEEGEPSSYVNTYATPEPSQQSPCLTVHKFTGFISCPTIVNILDHLRQNLVSSEAPWLALTVHGFHNAPVSWKQKEHGYLKLGDNFYTIVVFPDDTYWLVQSVGMWDVCP